jgi:regulator of replication initiation timing
MSQVTVNAEWLADLQREHEAMQHDIERMQAREVELLTESERLQAQLAEYKAGAAAEAKAGDEARRELAEAREALAWYGEQARLCRLVHSEGDAGRQALDDDGGKRARDVLAGQGVESDG